MQTYTLIYPAPGGKTRETYEFQALSLESALEVAKRSAVGEWAELHEDGMPVCRMQLVDSSGLWRVSGVRSQV